MKKEIKRKLEIVGYGLAVTCIMFALVAILAGVMPTVEELVPVAETILKNLGQLN